MVPQHNMADVFKTNHARNTTLKIFLKEYLPSRLCDVLCDNFFKNKPLKEFSLKDIQAIGQKLNIWVFTPNGTEGYLKAEVTLGGVDTKELSSKTMESSKTSGLYFIGEAVDVTGHLGGYNFQWAWASGFAAGQYA
jgi:predicted Rossmann fold flavoprotein